MRDATFRQSLDDLTRAFRQSPAHSFKVTNYFPAYVELFGHLRGTKCTFIETGVYLGGSLCMWRDWLGPDARIIGIDLNPEVAKWREHGFEILIGDQGDPAFWRDAFTKIGSFDAFLDDGGHQTFQQIVTLEETLRAASSPCIIAIEDTHASFMKQFAKHQERTFVEYAKASTDLLQAKHFQLYEGQFPIIANPASMATFGNVQSIRFYAGIVAFDVDANFTDRPESVWNKELPPPQSDFRYEGKDSATVQWPSPLVDERITILGGQT